MSQGINDDAVNNNGDSRLSNTEKLLLQLAQNSTEMQQQVKRDLRAAAMCGS